MVNRGNPSAAAEVVPSIADKARAGFFELLNPAFWEGIEPPPREWMLHEWLPRRRAAYLTGAGGAGKSLLSQQLATCIALGLPFLGVETAQRPSIYLTAEDDADELQRRQRAICASLGVREWQLSGQLHLVSLFGQPENEMVAFDRDGGILVSPSWTRLQNTAGVTQAGFIVLDNVSHVFAGNEIDRSQVTGFANLLNGLALAIDGTVLLIGHPNKQGDSYSGSTAWENAFRARLYFDAPKGENAHTDPDARQLTLPKANYARKGAAIDVRWLAGALVREDTIPQNTLESTRDISAAVAANAAFLKCLDVATGKQRAVSHVPGVNYAPKVFAGMIEGKGFDVTALAAGMERLLHLGQIELDQELWRRANRHFQRGIRRSAQCANPSANSLKNLAPTPAPAPCVNPRQDVSQVIEIACADPASTLRQTHTIPYGDIERPLEGVSHNIPDDDLDWSPDGGEGYDL